MTAEGSKVSKTAVVAFLILPVLLALGFWAGGALLTQKEVERNVNDYREVRIGQTICIEDKFGRLVEGSCRSGSPS